MLGVSSRTRSFCSNSTRPQKREIVRSGKSSASAHSKVSEIAVCTNKTCKRQGSLQILRVLEDLELSDGVGISVRSSGCLGNCGSGPNVALDNNVVLRSVGTVASAFKVLKEFCSHEVPEDVKQCIQLKLQANALAGQGKLESARDIYMRALELAPPHIEYKLHSNMSLLALSSGDTTEALAQAQKALELAPQDFTTAKIRMIEALLADERTLQAREYLELAVQQDKSFAATPIFKELQQKVKQLVRR